MKRNNLSIRLKVCLLVLLGGLLPLRAEFQAILRNGSDLAVEIRSDARPGETTRLEPGTDQWFRMARSTPGEHQDLYHVTAVGVDVPACPLIFWASIEAGSRYGGIYCQAQDGVRPVLSLERREQGNPVRTILFEGFDAEDSPRFAGINAAASALASLSRPGSRKRKLEATTSARGPVDPWELPDAAKRPNLRVDPSGPGASAESPILIVDSPRPAGSETKAPAVSAGPGERPAAPAAPTGMSLADGLLSELRDTHRSVLAATATPAFSALPLGAKLALPFLGKAMVFHATPMMQPMELRHLLVLNEMLSSYQAMELATALMEPWGELPKVGLSRP